MQLYVQCNSIFYYSQTSGFIHHPYIRVRLLLRLIATSFHIDLELEVSPPGTQYEIGTNPPIIMPQKSPPTTIKQQRAVRTLCNNI